MKYCCENIKKAHIIIFAGSRQTDQYVKNDLFNKFNKGTLDSLNSHFHKAQEEISNCNCFTVEKYVTRESWDNLKNDYDKLIIKYNELAIKYGNSETQQINALVELDMLKVNHEDLKEKVEELNQKILGLSTSEAEVRQEAIGLREQLTDIRQQLTLSQEEARDEKNNAQILNIQVNDLRIESNGRQNQLQVVSRELTTVQAERDERITPLELRDIFNVCFEKDEEISSLKGRINSLREELSQSRGIGVEEKLRNKEQKLEVFTSEHTIEWVTVRNLIEAYEDLIQSRKNYNCDRIRDAEDNIEALKEGMKQITNLSNVHRIFDDCEEIAKLRMEQQNLYQQQFESRVVVIPPRGF